MEAFGGKWLRVDNYFIYSYEVNRELNDFHVIQNICITFSWKEIPLVIAAVDRDANGTIFINAFGFYGDCADKWSEYQSLLLDESIDTDICPRELVGILVLYQSIRRLGTVNEEK